MMFLREKMFPRVCFCVLLSSCFLASDVDAQSADRKSRVVVKNLNDAEAKIDRALRQTAAMDFFETRLADIAEELETDYQIQVLIHESAADNGCDEEMLVTHQSNTTSLAAALMTILEPMDCTVMIRNEALQVVSSDYADGNLEKRIFDCREMLENFPGDKQDLNDKLLDAIQNAVDPDSWQNNGGRGTISIVNGQFVVTQSYRNLKDTEELLNSFATGKTGSSSEQK